MPYALPQSHSLFMKMLEYEIKQYPINASYDLVAQFGPKNYIIYRKWCDVRGFSPLHHERLHPLMQDEVEDDSDVSQARRLLKILHPADGIRLKKQLAQYLSPVYGAWKFGQDAKYELGSSIPFGKNHPIWILDTEFAERYFSANQKLEYFEENWSDEYEFTPDVLNDAEFWMFDGIDYDDGDAVYSPWGFYNSEVRLNPKTITLQVTAYDIERDGSDSENEWEQKSYISNYYPRLSDILEQDWLPFSEEEDVNLDIAKVIYDAIGYNPTLKPARLVELDEWWSPQIVFYPTSRMPIEVRKELLRVANEEVKAIMANL